MNKIVLVGLSLGIAIICITTSGFPSETLLPREALVEDVLQLSRTIESVHPDPYINCGGKIAYHRQLQNILRSIPEMGMEKSEFYFLIAPFVTSIKDAHTWLKAPDEFSWGLPFYFDVVDTTLYVAGSLHEEQSNLVGFRLVAIDDVQIAKIVDRAEKLVSAENRYQVLRNLARSGMLLNRWYLDVLVPSCRSSDLVAVKFAGPDGYLKSFDIPWPDFEGTPSLHGYHSDLQLPSRAKCDFVYDFVDSMKTVALLDVEGMESYREAFEMSNHEGREFDLARANMSYERFNSASAPDDRAELMKGIPSATEKFISLVREMKEAGTRDLIVDLRRNGGGNSAMADILVYVLYGREALLSAKSGQMEVLKLSPEYLENHRNAEPSSRDGYDFSRDLYHDHSEGIEVATAELEEMAEAMPTFMAEYRNGNDKGYSALDHVIVLCSPWTFSSGYTMMYYLYRAGAKILGTPSAQAGNCFGETFTIYKMRNSGLEYTVSCKYYEKFPEDPKAGRVLKMDYPMNYAKLVEYNFDRNAEILYALDVLKHTP